MSDYDEKVSFLKVRKLLKSAETLRSENLQECLRLSNSALEGIENLPGGEEKESLRLEALHNKVHCLFFSGQLKAALQEADKALRSLDGFVHSLHFAGILNVRGLIRSRLGLTSAALDDFLRALTSLEFKEQYVAVIQVRMNIAFAYDEAGFQEGALSEYDRCLKDIETVEEDRLNRRALIRFNRALCLKDLQGDPDAAADTLLDIKEGLKANDPFQILGLNYANTVVFLVEAQKYEAAKREMDELSRNFNLDNVGPTISGTVHYAKAFFYLETENPFHDLEDGFSSLERAEDLLSEIDGKTILIKCLKLRAEAESKRGAYKAAAKAYEKLANWSQNQRNQFPEETRLMQMETLSQDFNNIKVRHEMENRFNAENLAAKLKETLKQKEEYIRVIGHDLRNEIGIIITSAEYLLEVDYSSDSGIEDKTDSHDFMNFIYKSGNNALQILRMILDLDRVDSNDSYGDLGVFDLYKLFSDIIERESASAKFKDIVIRLKIDEEIHKIQGYSMAVERILSNYLSNAVKYSPKGKPVEIRIVNETHSYQLQVVDQGPGIPQDKVSFLFQKYKTVGSKPTGNEHSTGLGLYLVRKIAEKCSMKVRYRPNPDGGSIFELTIPK